MSGIDNPLGFGNKNKRKKLSKAIKTRIARGQNWKCGRCQGKIEEFGFDIHHKNGDSSNNNITNLQALCVKCHRLVTQKQNREKDTRKNVLDDPLGF